VTSKVELTRGRGSSRQESIGRFGSHAAELDSGIPLVIHRPVDSCDFIEPVVGIISVDGGSRPRGLDGVEQISALG